MENQLFMGPQCLVGPRIGQPTPDKGNSKDKFYGFRTDIGTCETTSKY